MLILRRFLAVAALMFWQGGFTFYAAIVVPVGQEVLGSHLEQGFITRVVTRQLNFAGAVALGLLAFELLHPARKTSGLRKYLWLGMALVLAALIAMHPTLDALIDIDAHALIERSSFRTRHRIYLWVSTLEWALAGVYVWLMLRDWDREVK